MKVNSSSKWTFNVFTQQIFIEHYLVSNTWNSITKVNKTDKNILPCGANVLVTCIEGVIHYKLMEQYHTAEQG